MGRSLPTQGGEGEGDFGAVLRKKPREPRGSDDEQEEENGAGGKRGGKGARKRVQQVRPTSRLAQDGARSVL